MKPFPTTKLGPQVIISGVNGKVASEQLELANFLKIFFEFAYYQGVSPFRFEQDINRPSFFRKKVWRPQQIVCAFLHLLCIFTLITEIRENIPEDWNHKNAFKNPTKYFDIALGVCVFFYKIITLKRFWFNGGEYLKILNFIVKNNSLPVTNKWVTKSSFVYTVYAFSTIKIFSSLATGYNIVVPIQKWSPSSWLRHIWGHGRFAFCFSSLDVRTHPPELESFTTWDGVLVGLTIIMAYMRYALSDVCDLIILACVLTLWTPASSFSNEIDNLLIEDDDECGQNENLDQLQRINVQKTVKKGNQNQNTSTWSLIYSRFQSIQKLSERINTALGSQVSWYMTEGLFFYSISLHTVLLTKDENRRFHKVTFYVLTFIILYIAADICKKMESVRTWLFRDNNIKSVPDDEANLVLHEMITKDIGIRGSDVFTITFPLVAGFLSLIVTFFIICVQENYFLQLD